MNRDSHWERPRWKRQLKSIVGELSSKIPPIFSKNQSKISTN